MKELGVFLEGEDEGESERKTNAVLRKMQGCADKLMYRSKSWSIGQTIGL